MSAFVGRNREINALSRQLDRVRSTNAGPKPGQCVLVRGRRRVGKSRLIEEFCTTSNTPLLFFTASQQGARELDLFAEEVKESNLPGREIFIDAHPGTWDGALRLLAAVLSDSEPSIVVFDEFPYLVTDDPTIEATFQKQWDRHLSRKPVLLILVGSDLAMMESLNTHGRAFFQRGTEMVVPSLSPAETATIVGASNAADAFDAYLITGGLPLICDEWSPKQTLWKYLEGALSEPTSALIVSGERVLAAEFPTETQARAVLGQIGSGEVTFSKIARAAGGIQAATLTRALDVLVSKRMVVRETPLSTSPSKEARYRIADPYLRFWLRFIGPGLAEIERGRGDRVLDRVRRDWAPWRGRAIEPIVREALARHASIQGLPTAEAVGGYWTRTNVPEIDLIGADRSPIATKLAYAGTIKWLDKAPLDQADVNQLAADVLQVPGATAKTPLVAVSRSGVTATNAIAVSPDDLIEAWATLSGEVT
jgi:uncharacterized protein